MADLRTVTIGYLSVHRSARPVAGTAPVRRVFELFSFQSVTTFLVGVGLIAARPRSDIADLHFSVDAVVRHRCMPQSSQSPGIFDASDTSGRRADDLPAVSGPTRLHQRSAGSRSHALRATPRKDGRMSIGRGSRHECPGTTSSHRRCCGPQCSASIRNADPHYDAARTSLTAQTQFAIAIAGMRQAFLHQALAIFTVLLEIV